MMWRLLILLFICLTIASCGSDVFVCTGPYSTKYHDNPDCSGLYKCSAEITTLSKENAIDKGYSPCRICY